jgi:outer membrane protein assembly factor BamB
VDVSLAAGATTTATVTGIGSVPLPPNVQAVAVNVIANRPSGDGHLALYPAGGTAPADSTVNFQRNRTTAGFEVVRVSPAGQLTIYASAPTRVVVRLRGWYTSASATVTGARFVPVPPSTVLGNVAVAAGGTADFVVNGAAGANGIPASSNVKAVAVSVIANQPTGTGHLQLWPSASPRPVDSSVNFQQGQNTAGFDLVPFSSGGRISVQASAATRVVVRVRGYFTVSPYTDTGGTFTPVAPAAVVDTGLPAGASWTVTITGGNGIPAPPGVSAVAVNVIAARPTGTGHLTLHPAGPPPVNSTLNFQQGLNRANFEVVPVSPDGHITIHTTAATRVVVRLRGWYSPAGAPAGADWPQYRNGPEHPGTNGAETVLSPSTVAGLGQAWTALATTAVRSAPAVVGGVVYVAGFDGQVRALDAATGATRWTASTGGAIRSSPAVAGGLVYVGSQDGRLYALDAVTGLQRWTAAMGRIDGAPTVAGGVVYVGSADRSVRALNAASGAAVWTASVGGSVENAPAVAGGRVYVRARDGVAYALDAASGATVWTADIGHQNCVPGEPCFFIPAAPSAPVVAGGRVYVVGPLNARLYALDAATGAVAWSIASGFTISGTPAVTGGRLYAVLDHGISSCDLGALDAATGAAVWTIPGGSLNCVSSTAPVVANGVLFHGNRGVLVARNPATGAVLQTDSTTPGRSDSTINSVVVANGAVYTGREAGASAHHP